ncbi:hypothetical protein RIF29_34452 [Crotalaria pallida]|uniref:Uncharacterized protein n=1 Tax=Crotalaria pallida TaxID=3830 RepID=A0AAN9HR89_CROPI
MVEEQVVMEVKVGEQVVVAVKVEEYLLVVEQVVLLTVKRVGSVWCAAGASVACSSYSTCGGSEVKATAVSELLLHLLAFSLLREVVYGCLRCCLSFIKTV